jgi:hypothetical protein
MRCCDFHKYLLRFVEIISICISYTVPLIQKGKQMPEQPKTLADALEAAGITIEAVFVPAAKGTPGKDLRLNWRVAVDVKGRRILETDYTQGVGHCPAYKASVRELGGRDCVMRWDAIERECQTGETWRASFSGESRKRIPAPTAAEVMYCLISDASAIDHPTYESWASDLGYDEDSRKGEAIYRACLEIGLKLRAALGDAGLETLREASADF